MANIVFPIEQVLLENIIRLGLFVAFPGNKDLIESIDGDVSEEIVNYIDKIYQENKLILQEMSSDGFLLWETKYTTFEIVNDINIQRLVFTEANRSLDYIRISQCLFSRPEYLIGQPGKWRDKQMCFIASENGSFSNTIIAGPQYYVMQQGIGLDLALNPFKEGDPLYNILYSSRIDEVYYEYRSILGMACDAMSILDLNRCFVYLFSKADRMGHCSSYNFKDNKIRIIACLSSSQEEFDHYSNQLYFFSEEVRTKIVHYGENILDNVSLSKAYDVINSLYLIIVNFCSVMIQSGIDNFANLDIFISQKVEMFEYNSPTIEDKTDTVLPAFVGNNTLYYVEIANLIVKDICRIGNILLIPQLTNNWYQDFYNSYVQKDITGECDSNYNDLSIAEFEYILEILKYRSVQDALKRGTIALVFNMPFFRADIVPTIKEYEYLCDYVCSKVDDALGYFIITSHTPCKNDVLPPRAGLLNNIRTIYRYDDEVNTLRPIPGRVYGIYCEPNEQYTIDAQIFGNSYDSDIYDIFFKEHQGEVLKNVKTAMVRLGNTYYIHDWTLRINYLFDILDMLFPQTTNGDKLLKRVLAFCESNREDYDQLMIKMIDYRNKYRNPILHGGRNVWEITTTEQELEKVALDIEMVIVRFSIEVFTQGVSTWSDFENAFHNCQKVLGLVK